MDIIIRESTVEDFPAILSLIKEFSIFQKTPEKVTVTLEQMIIDQHIFRCYLAETPGKEIIGFVSYYLAYYSWTGRAMYVDDLYVKTDFRKQLIGKKLLSTVVDLAKKEGCKKVRWQVSKWNLNAIEFYKKLGATIDDTDMNCDLLLNEII